MRRRVAHAGRACSCRSCARAADATSRSCRSTLAALMPPSFRLFARAGTPATPQHGRSRTSPTACGSRRSRWAGSRPPRPARGHPLAAIGALAALGGAHRRAAVGLVARDPARSMTSSDRAGRAATRRRAGAAALIPRWLPFLPHNRTGAVAAKELRYFVRDPRRRAPLIGALIVPGLFLFATLRDAPTRPAARRRCSRSSRCCPRRASRSTSSVSTAPRSGRRSSRATIRAPTSPARTSRLLVMSCRSRGPALITASFTHGWAYLPLTLGLAPGSSACCSRSATSCRCGCRTRCPTAATRSRSIRARVASGGLAALGALLVDALVLVPVGIVTAIALQSLSLPAATVFSVVVADVYGAAAWFAGLRDRVAPAVVAHARAARRGLAASRRMRTRPLVRGQVVGRLGRRVAQLEAAFATRSRTHARLFGPDIACS